MAAPEQFDDKTSIEGLREIASIRREKHDQLVEIAGRYEPPPGQINEIASLIRPLLPEGTTEEAIVSYTDPGDFGND